MRGFLSQRVHSVPPSGLRRFFNIIASTEDVISLGLGEPDFVTPQYIREAGLRSLEEGRTSYTPNPGMLELRQELAKHLEALYGVSYRPREGDPYHRRSLRGSSHRPPGHHRSGRRGHRA